MKNIVASLVAVFILSGCKGEGTVASDTRSGDEARVEVNLTPEQLGELGAQIAKDPENGKKLLEERGLDEASFEKAVREVTEDAEASKKYAEAYRNQG